jgi:phosphoribosyl-dephospho-CoA transferase
MFDMLIKVIEELERRYPIEKLVDVDISERERLEIIHKRNLLDEIKYELEGKLDE